VDDRGRAFFRFIGWTAGVALVVVLALYAVLMIQIHFDRQPPDVAGIAHSQPVVAADQAATSAISEGLKSLAPAHTPGLVAGPTAIFDGCASQQAASFMPSWTPTVCTRAVTEYFFSNTPFQQHLQAWSAALRTSGWTAFSPNPTATDYQRPPPANSAVPVPTIDLTFRFAQRPRASLLFVAGYGSFPPESTTAASWIQKVTVSPGVVDSAPFAQYPYVAEVALFARYYDPSNPPTPTPTGNPASGQCITGSGTCN
jgi:hypothetical protein